MPLRDVMMHRPRVLFVGINPSLMSEAAGHHFAGRRNAFWKLLYASGLIPEPLGHSDDGRLEDFRMALTNLCPRATRSAAELRPEELERGRRTLERKVRRIQPEIVALVGVTIYRRLFRRAKGDGPGLKQERMDGARVFVLPNPSGLNVTFPSFSSKLHWFQQLRELLHELPPSTPG